VYPRRSISSTTEWIYHRVAYIIKKTSHRLTSVEDGAGGQTYFGYENGNLIEITDTLGNMLYIERIL